MDLFSEFSSSATQLKENGEDYGRCFPCAQDAIGSASHIALARNGASQGMTRSPLILTDKGCKRRQRTLKERLSDSQVQNVHIHLPESAQILQEILRSNEKLLQLIGHFGGCTVRVPAQWPPHGQKPDYKGHPLRSVLSGSQMKRVVSHFGGTDLYVPRCTKHILRLRDQALTDSFCKETRKGKSTGHVVQKLARRYQISDRRVWGILKNSVERV